MGGDRRRLVARLAPHALRLATPIRSSAGGALVDFTAGAKNVFAVVPGAYFEQSPTELTIAGGAVTLRQEFHTIDTEGDAALGILDAVAWGPIREGKRVALMAANSGRAVYLAASTTVGLPCLLSAAWPTEFRRTRRSATSPAKLIAGSSISRRRGPRAATSPGAPVSIGRSAFMGGYNNVAAAIDGLRVMFSSGNIASGEALLYGLRNA